MPRDAPLTRGGPDSRHHQRRTQPRSRRTNWLDRVRQTGRPSHPRISRLSRACLFHRSSRTSPRLYRGQGSHRMNAAEILQELVAIPTPSAASNLPLINWVVSFLQTRGWQASLFSYTDENGVDKANLIARPSATSPQSAIDLAFICHTDTVPFAQSWTEALQLRADGQYLHGCGACDVKGSLACFLAAIDSISTRQTHPDIALILTADEEIGCKGMDRLLAQTDLRIRSAIVSEPTSLHPGIAGKGYGLARITVHGAEAHSAFPAEGSSAIAAAAELIVRIQQLETIPQQMLDTLCDPPRTTINIGTIHGGTAKNIVAGECSFLVEWRPTPNDPPQAVLEALQALATSAEPANPRILF